MKKILFVATVQSHIMNFHVPYLEHWKKKGYEVHVATKIDEKKYDNIELSLEDIKWNQIDFDRNPFSKHSIIALKQLVKLMKENEYELVHVHTPVGSILGRLAAKFTNTKNIVYTAHGFHFYKGAPMKNWIIYYSIEKIMARYTDALITINEEDYITSKKNFKTRCKNGIFKVNGVGIDLNKYKMNEDVDLEFKKSLGLEKTDFVITIVAELIKRKNHSQIIESMEVICKSYKDIKVLFVGDGELFLNIKKEIIKKKLSENIIMLGFRTDVEKILNISDIVGLFSYHEGLPKNIMEAMVAGKPIICTNIRGNKDLIDDNSNGFLVDIDDIEGTVEKIVALYEDRNLINKMGINNRNCIKDYEINKVLKDVEKIYKKLGI